MANAESNSGQPDSDLKSRSPNLLVIHPSDTAEQILVQLKQREDFVDVLCLTVGSETDEFRDLPAVAAWVRSFRQAESTGPHSQRCLLVLAPPLPTPTETSHITFKEELRLREELTHDLGVVLFDRIDAPGGFRDITALQQWLTVQQPAHAPIFFWFRQGLQTQLQPLPEGSEFGEESGDAKVDPDRLQRGIDTLNKANWWELDY